MAAISYPADGAVPQVGTFRQSYADTFVGDEGEVGSSRRRNRYTKALRQFSFTASRTEAQRVVDDVFYASTLSNGVFSFEWTHPTTGEAILVLFKSRPGVAATMPGHWQMSITLVEI